MVWREQNKAGVARSAGEYSGKGKLLRGAAQRCRTYDMAMPEVPENSYEYYQIESLESQDSQVYLAGLLKNLVWAYFCCCWRTETVALEGQIKTEISLMVESKSSSLWKYNIPAVLGGAYLQRDRICTYAWWWFQTGWTTFMKLQKNIVLERNPKHYKLWRNLCNFSTWTCARNRYAVSHADPCGVPAGSFLLRTLQRTIWGTFWYDMPYRRCAYTIESVSFNFLHTFLLISAVVFELPSF